MDTASEVEELEVDSVSLLPAASEGNSGGARIQVFLARYRWALLLTLPPSVLGCTGDRCGQRWIPLDIVEGGTRVLAEHCAYGTVEPRRIP